MLIGGTNTQALFRAPEQERRPLVVVAGISFPDADLRRQIITRLAARPLPVVDSTFDPTVVYTDATMTIDSVQVEVLVGTVAGLVALAVSGPQDLIESIMFALQARLADNLVGNRSR